MTPRFGTVLHYFPSCHRHIHFGLVTACAFAVVVGSGCTAMRNRSPFADLAKNAGGHSGGIEDADGVDHEMLDAARIQNDSIQPVHFDYNSYALTPKAIEILIANARILKEVPDATIQIAGHCDERGTQEYNLVLGEQRAMVVREFLVQLGVPAERVRTITFGEEQPEVDGHDEDAWARNRRAAFGIGGA